MRGFIKPLLLGAALLSVPALAATRDTPEVKLQKLIGERVAGAPVDCIDLHGSQSSQIIDGKAIVYRSGAKLYVNTPKSGAESLNDDDILVTKTFSSQLCRMDAVHMVDRSSGFPRGFVLLDKFVPYTKAKTSK
ncbi:hypothetical protein AB2M62_19700 [Sphingomonas sp. MMS12-HWE2-04]|uniref:hypothetical protein n=1 Tax=Sphingomonas sp. MMS12-HWE2-04 TaxID=3234199 RepID=UPI00384EADBB